MRSIKGYVTLIDDPDKNTTREEECMVFEFFPWSNGTVTFPVAVIMLNSGELQQHPITNIRIKVNKNVSTTVLQ